MKLRPRWTAGLLLGAVALASGPGAERQYFRYERTVRVGEAGAQACAVVDATTFAHSGPGLRDVRLYQGAVEVPYTVSLSETAGVEDESVRVLNLRQINGRVDFDLQMPGHLYTDVTLQIDAKDFVAAASVTGSDTVGGHGARLGDFTVFDLSGQKLSRSTMLHLQESNYRYLHVELVSQGSGGVSGLRGDEIRGAIVPPSRQAQTVYSTSVDTTAIAQRGHQTVATLELPAGVPAERIAFELDPNFKGNFRRDVHISAKPKDTSPRDLETVDGEISRVRMTVGGDTSSMTFANGNRVIEDVRLEMPATLGANLHGDALVEIAVENGDDAPLPIKSVRVEMRERKLCFDVAKAPSPVMYYGDAALLGPVYDFAKLPLRVNEAATAKLMGEVPNPEYRERPDTRPFTERHPELMWVVLLAVISVLGMVALRSSRRMH